MGNPVPLDIVRLRRGCSQCSLQQLCLPAGISGDDLAQLDDIVRRRRPLDRGERLFRFGDALASVYVARDGAFKTVSSNEAGDEQVIGFHLPGELIGLDALGTGLHRCEAIALTTANVWAVSAITTETPVVFGCAITRGSIASAPAALRTATQSSRSAKVSPWRIPTTACTASVVISPPFV